MSVISFKQKNATSGGTGRPPPGSPIPVWNVRQITTGSSKAWMQLLLRQHHKRNALVNLFTRLPQLQTATERLLHLLTFAWPSQSGQPLICEVIGRAADRTELEMDRGNTHAGRLIGLYLYHLIDCLEPALQVQIVGTLGTGEQIAYAHFSEALGTWAKKNKVVSLECVAVDSLHSKEHITGLRTHLLASIALPIDVGHLLHYAPHG